MKGSLIALAPGGNCPCEGVHRAIRLGILLREEEIEDPLLYTRGSQALVHPIVSQSAVGHAGSRVPPPAILTL